MALETAFRLIKDELKTIIIDNPGISVKELAEHFEWRPSHIKKFMRNLRDSSGINGHEFFLFETKYYYNPDTRQYKLLCYEMGYAIEHNKPKLYDPHKPTSEERNARIWKMEKERVAAAKRKKTPAQEQAFINSLWPKRKVLIE